MGTTRYSALVAAFALTSAVLAGCGTGSGSPSTSEQTESGEPAAEQPTNNEDPASTASSQSPEDGHPFAQFQTRAQQVDDALLSCSAKTNDTGCADTKSDLSSLAIDIHAFAAEQNYSEVADAATEIVSAKQRFDDENCDQGYTPEIGVDEDSAITGASECSAAEGGMRMG